MYVLSFLDEYLQLLMIIKSSNYDNYEKLHFESRLNHVLKLDGITIDNEKYD